jgi:hypothetical protein
LGYSLRANRKTREGDSEPDRDAQFHYINAAASAAQTEREPVISVDTTKKELVGDAEPLVSYCVIVDLISATTTKTGITVRCEIDRNTYPKGVVISDAEIAAINVTRHDFHGEWNHTIKPNSS